MFNEQEIIERLRQAFIQTNQSVVGIGDDAAVIPLSDTENYVITKDLLVEDKHFSLRYFDPESLAHKALHVNLSDLAAMGATLCFALLGISIPLIFSEKFFDQFLMYFAEACQENGVHLIGGDTTASGDKFVVSLTLIGRAPLSHLKYRHTTKAGDIIAIAGNLGHAHMGLQALEKDIPGLESFKSSALQPIARLKEGLWFGAHKGVTAMMDVSDGLHIDLTRLCESSKVGAEIHVEDLILQKDFLKGCIQLKLDPLECLLVGGEDYGLLVTICASIYDEVSQTFEKNFGYPLLCVGKIIDGHSIKLMKKGSEMPFTYRPFSHFGEA